MEDRQVSLKQMLDAVDEMPVMKDNNGIEFIMKSLVKMRIGLLPSAQPEIIRCKDCKWSEEYVPMCKTYYYCRKQGLYGKTEEDFCSHAERREEGEQE